MRKRYLFILLILVFTFFIIITINTHNSKKHIFISVEENTDKFVGGAEIESPSDHMQLYDTKVEYYIKNVKWDDDANGTAEVVFRSPDLEALIQEALDFNEDIQKAVQHIDHKLEAGDYNTKEYSIEMAVVKENGNMRLVVNDNMLEILNGCSDTILANAMD